MASRYILLPLLLICSTHARGSEDLLITSAVAQTPLLELYTSEGCSSCPPADRWLASLADDGSLWSAYVPLAFHVTYWNYLGWQDRFAKPSFDARQRQTAQRSGAGVYTPGIFYQGREWRGWRHARAPWMRASRPKVGVLQARMNCKRLQARFSPQDSASPPSASHINLAWLTAEQGNQITRGENRGHTLAHEFVVMNLTTAPLTSAGKAKGLVAEVAQPCANAAGAHAVALWVSNIEGVPIQAVGRYLPKSFLTGIALVGTPPG